MLIDFLVLRGLEIQIEGFGTAILDRVHWRGVGKRSTSMSWAKTLGLAYQLP